MAIQRSLHRGRSPSPSSRVEERARRRSLVAAALAPIALAAASSGGCSDGASDLPEPDVAETIQAVVPSPPAGCTGTRWLAVKAPASVCPSAAPLWSESDVFGPLAPPGLAPYCLYEWAGGGGPTPPDMTALHLYLYSQGILEIEEDCPIVGPLGQFTPDTRQWLSENLLDAAGALSPLPSGDPAKIRVAVPDSSPDSSGPSIPVGQLDHGYTMASIIGDLTCPGGDPCVSRVATQLALPHVTNSQIDTVKGGYFGTRIQLAQAIYRAVEGWKSASAAQPRLAINLSVGWDTDMGCGSPSAPLTMTPEQHVVLAALTHASCNGALVTAAAGNAPGGPLPLYPNGWSAPPAGPVCPAAWSTEPAPTHGQCASFEGPGYASTLNGYVLRYTRPIPAPVPPVDDALLYAVGGVDYKDAPITRSRSGGIPRVVAIGLQGVGSSQGGGAVQPLTGTSVATAVVSGVAAAVWAYRPELTAAEVMDIVYRSGVPLPLDADFHASGVSGDVRRASLCAAMKMACPPKDAHSRCPKSPILCDPSPSISGGAQNPPLTPALRSLLASEWDGAPEFMASQKPPTLPAPEAEWRSLSVPPWVHPQPSRPPCGACVFKPADSRLYVSIDAAYPAELTLSRMTLTLTGPGAQGQGRTSVIIEMPNPGSMTRNTAPFTINGVSWSALAEVQTATLSWLVTDAQNNTTASVQEQILIDL